MVKQSDLIIAYVTREWGGAYKTLEKAIKLNKKIINVADK